MGNENTELMSQQIDQADLKEFRQDSETVGKQTQQFLELVYPAYCIDPEEIENHLDTASAQRLEWMSFFRIGSCTAENADQIFERMSERFEKLFTAFHAIDVPVAYGIVSRDGVTNLVLGVYAAKGNTESIIAMTQGMLSGIKIDSVKPFSGTENATSGAENTTVYHGLLTGVPSLYVKDEKQNFSLSTIMRTLNGQNYSLLFIAKPVPNADITGNIQQLISIKDQAFAVSKRNIARSSSYAKTTSESYTYTETKNNKAASIFSIAGSAAGGFLGSVIPVIGTAAGTAIGWGLGTLIGNAFGKTRSEGYSKSVSEAITNGGTVSGDIQNGFALELMNYADHAIERLKAGQNNGIWQTAITYSAQSEEAGNIIQACLRGELSKTDAENLPMLAFKPKPSADVMRIPDFLESAGSNPLCTWLNSAELGLLCTVPTESVPDFELRLERKLPLTASRSDAVQIGNVADGRRALENMPFGLSEGDLNKHTFVCGITGSGKTTTVKKILFEAKKPFLVIEPAKKEYRNLNIEGTEVYTPGKPELNAPKINPFYIIPGVSPQMHIDYLKDLFNASFSFYGPMPYILEKCLHTVYRNKGWDLTLGYHPMLVKTDKIAGFFDIEHTREQYKKHAHRCLFPTMQELKDEIARYVENELKYDGEVAGNVKTAMKVRLENLCVGAKGYTFNTSEFMDFDELLKNRAVFELEGLADDSDKAFSVGLLIIFINEYRQVQKESGGSGNTPLQHLLVIEEAHRLLKNVETERSTETIGNPKGKAVEHFTNMLAEMRSYGQGVIVAEQIPTKIAPDVIKNSSTKIVQRIVSADDQQVIANTVGLSSEDAIQLGTLETGYAYCHKEGMALPAPVKIRNCVSEDGKEKNLDVYVRDSDLFGHANDKRGGFKEIDLSNVRSFFSGSQEMKQKALALLNTIMAEPEKLCVSACDNTIKYIIDEPRRNNVPLLTQDITPIAAGYMSELILSWMVRGVYCTKKLPDDGFVTLLENTLKVSTEEKVRELKRELRVLYAKDPARYAKGMVAALVQRSLKPGTDVGGTIRQYFTEVSDQTVAELEEILKGGR